MTRGKRTNTVAVRVDDETLAELDRYQRELETNMRLPMSRSLVLLQLIEGWAEERSRARMDPA